MTDGGGNIVRTAPQVGLNGDAATLSEFRHRLARLRVERVHVPLYRSEDPLVCTALPEREPSVVAPPSGRRSCLEFPNLLAGRRVYCKHPLPRSVSVEHA